MARYIRFWLNMFKESFSGSKTYYLWVGVLTALLLPGIYSYYLQLSQGLVVTNMVDQVSWGAYIANFTFLVGVAAAAVLLVVPAYIYHRDDVKEIVLLGEILAFCAMLMCLLFIAVDLGRPDRFWHIIPFIGRLNFPQSILAWDVIVLNGYLLLNMHIPGYLLYKLYRGEQPTRRYYMPFVIISIFWAVSIHTVTAFLYSGLGGRPFWNTSLMAPRFLISAFAAGPALLIIIFYLINRFHPYFRVKESVSKLLITIASVTMPINLFLLGSEVFKEFYTNSSHVASAQYLFLGLHGHSTLVPYIWTAIAFNIISTIIFVTPVLRSKTSWLLGGCLLSILGIWTEKGMGLIIPGFIPSPLGDVVEYTPSIHEFFICLAIWAFGALSYTVISKVAISIVSGRLKE
ncbi:MAG: polysulfide reductase NrfD [Bdellovibrionales bacterium]|jgi:Ni/Fe-hydrogenase subunit HybB-like protein|nr:polysulfide reductase NrfD [Bdellovibrionales bacterium]MBT3526488.1 polysulfide reductase NrfD [Bdellovibrionales bacterium]MBT7670371.1 polysulfide reductase NrfD [Bdellovibrionales bacterium]MBT7766850.1 polysulfide reductase NrfD [Bdellovibrionales bacterium]